MAAFRVNLAGMCVFWLVERQAKKKKPNPKTSWWYNWV